MMNSAQAKRYSKPASTRSSNLTSLPFGLKPYHVVLASYLSAIVILGTVYSVAYGTHLPNIQDRLPSFPNSISGGASSFPPSAASDTTSSLPPIPPTILPPNHALNYWANRKNIVNQIFVKKAWLWTTVAWLLQLFFLRLTPGTSSLQSDSNGSDRLTKDLRGNYSADSATGSNATRSNTSAMGTVDQKSTITSPVSISVLRYLTATVIWLLFANWFFGPPLSERILTATGAICVPNSDPTNPIEQIYCRNRQSVSLPTDLNTKAGGLGSAKSVRAIWKGGHDISGHTFLLVLSTLFLIEELIPFIPLFLGYSSSDAMDHKNRKNSWIDNIIPVRSWATASPTLFTHPRTALKAKVAFLFTVCLTALWSWMLWNTAIYFHTPQEKITGLIVAFLGALVLPKA